MIDDATLSCNPRHERATEKAPGATTDPIDTGIFGHGAEAKVASPKPVGFRRHLIQHYTHAERSRGGINAAANKRGRVHDDIDRILPCYLASVPTGKRPVMADFMAQVCPYLKNTTAAVRRYGAYFKARLKYHEDAPAVALFGMVIDAIRRGQAKRLCRPFAGGTFDMMRGFIHRLSSNPLKTSCKHGGAGWQNRFGCWGYFEDRNTGECFA